MRAHLWHRAAHDSISQVRSNSHDGQLLMQEDRPEGFNEVRISDRGLQPIASLTLAHLPRDDPLDDVMDAGEYLGRPTRFEGLYRVVAPGDGP